MNKVFFTLLCAIFITSVLFTSCETTESQSKEHVNSEKTISRKEKIKEPELPVEEIPVIPHFDDWEYKGFGAELPEWIENALDNKISELKKDLHFSEETELFVFIEKGVNADQAKQKLQQEIIQYKEDNSKEIEMVQEIWVRINHDYELTEEPYIAIEILK